MEEQSGGTPDWLSMICTLMLSNYEVGLESFH